VPPDVLTHHEHLIPSDIDQCGGVNPAGALEHRLRLTHAVGQLREPRRLDRHGVLLDRVRRTRPHGVDAVLAAEPARARHRQGVPRRLRHRHVAREPDLEHVVRS